MSVSRFNQESAMCAPCNHSCQQGRACPSRAQQAEPQTIEFMRKELGDAMNRLRIRFQRLRHPTPQH